MKALSVHLSSLVKPFGYVPRSMILWLAAVQAVLAVGFWSFMVSGIMPTPMEVFNAFGYVWFEQALGRELITSFWHAVKAIALATSLSLMFAYLSVIPVFKPVITFSTLLRFLGLTGFTIIFTLLTSSGEMLVVSILAFAVFVFFVTNMRRVVEGVKDEEINYAKTLRMNDWEVIWYVIVRGRLHSAFDVLRDNAAIAFMMLPGVEVLARSSGGVGVILANNARYLDKLPANIAAALSVLALGLAVDMAIYGTKHLVCPYAFLGQGSKR